MSELGSKADMLLRPHNDTRRVSVAAVEREISTASPTGHCSFLRLMQASEGDGIAQCVNRRDAALPIPAGRNDYLRGLLPALRAAIPDDRDITQVGQAKTRR